ncbi:MAG: DUF2065 family protein [Pseudomonadota bacterium]
MSDFFAAIALVAVIEGGALILFATSFPDYLRYIETMSPEQRRWLGLGLVGVGCLAYLAVRGGA